MPRELGIQLKATWEKLKADRAQLESLWDDIAFYTTPKDTDLVTKYNQDDPGANTPQTTVGIEANRVLASGLFSNTFSLMDPWFSLRSSEAALNELDPVKRWFARSSKTVLTEINNSNFPEVLHEVLLRLCSLCTDVLSIEYRAGRIQFASYPITLCCLAEDPYGQVDTVYRRFEYTARQAVARWGDGENMPNEIKVAAKDRGRAATRFPFIQSVYPREGVDLRRNARQKKDNKPFASIYFYEQGGDIVEEGGYDDFPYAAVRFTKTDGTPYGRGPGFDALAALRSLNRKEKDFDDATELSATPPMFLPYGTDASQIDMRPGAVNPVLNPANPTPVFADVRTNFQVLWQSKEGTEQQIRNLFFNSLFNNLGQLTGSNRMTATEVDARVDEKIQLLMPVANRLQTELYKRVVERSLALLIAAGKIEAPPQQVIAKPGYTIEYTSRLVSKMKDIETNRLAEGLQLCINVETGINAGQCATITKVADLVKCERQILENKGVSPDLIRSDDAITKMVEDEQAQQQQAAAAQAAVEKLKPIDLQKAPEQGSMMGDQGNAAQQMGVAANA